MRWTVELPNDLREPLFRQRNKSKFIREAVMDYLGVVERADYPGSFRLSFYIPDDLGWVLREQTNFARLVADALRYKFGIPRPLYLRKRG